MKLESSSRSVVDVTNSFTSIPVCRDGRGWSLQSCYCGCKLSVESLTKLVKLPDMTSSDPNLPSGNELRVLPM